MKASFISLGCAKNLVDTEFITGLIKEEKIQIIDSIEESDIIFINTCGFIASAKKESIDTIYDVIAAKRKDAFLVVIGCLAKRYKEVLQKEIPEIDLVIGVDEYDKIGELLNELLGNTKFNKTYDPLKRTLSSYLPTAYLKIGEGCSNFCAFCAIPLIRGKHQSYPKEQVLADAKRLISLGKREIIVIAQDPTMYGKDLYKDYGIAELMNDLVNIDKKVYFRILYLYPDRISTKLINVFKENPNLLPYFDIPIQHSSDHQLKLMRRTGTEEKYLKVIDEIKKEIPNAVLRTTLIVGFPQETAEDFLNLKHFIKKVRFNHLGVFTYSDEEDTASYKMDGKISHQTAKRRKDSLMKIQKEISKQINATYVGKTYKTLIEDFDGKYYTGRAYMYAPDAEDGCIYIASSQELIIGEFYDVTISGYDEYDLFGKV